MNRRHLNLPGLLLAGLPLAAQSANDAELQQLREQLERLRQSYQQQIQAMEQRIEELEKDRATERPATAAHPPAPAANSFNPRISVILAGRYYDDGAGGEGDTLLGEAAGFATHHNHGDDHGHAHGVERGFSLGETEIAFSATVDPYFDASLHLSVSEDGEVAVEEAWAETRALPAGLKLKTGKFLSGIGYVNSQHKHSWDFVDQNLAYRALLGNHGLADTGVQLTWLPDWPVYSLFGVEILQGEQELFGATLDSDEFTLDEDSGPRLTTAFAKFAPDLGYSHALQIGLFGAYTRQHQEEHEHGAEHHALDGDAWLAGTDWVYKYDAPGSYGQGDFKLQAEYLYRVKDLKIADADDADEIGEASRFRQDGFYAQTTYGFAPRWHLAGRYSVIGLKNAAGEEDFDSSDRWTLALDFRPTEFSLLRLQYSRADISTEDGDARFGQWYLQYQHSLGSHGAHKF